MVLNVGSGVVVDKENQLFEMSELQDKKGNLIRESIVPRAERRHGRPLIY